MQLIHRYAGVMIARARVALGGAMTEDPTTRDNSELEQRDITGEGPTWEAAKAACLIPDGALVLHWIREQ